MFSAAFAEPFAGVERQYICPMQAQAALAGGAAWVVEGDAMRIAGKRLIGPAGKVYAFASAATAQTWAQAAALVPVREAQIIAGLPVEVAEAWKARKREKLAVNAERLVTAASRQSDDRKRAALLAEADYCLTKWG